MFRQQAKKAHELVLNVECIHVFLFQFRQRTTFAIAFFVMFAVGFIFQLATTSWLLKALLLVLCYLIVYGLSM